MFWVRGKPQGRWSYYVCGLSDKSIKMVTDHIQSSHVTSTIFRCQFCNATYNDAQKLYRHHKIIHETTGPLKCPNCPTVYHNRGDLILPMNCHMGESRDNNPQDERAICHKCGLFFSLNDSFMSHVEACQGEVNPTDKIHIPPPPIVPATSIGFSSNMTPGSVERDETTKSLDMLRKIVKDTLKGGPQTIGHPEAHRSYWQNEEKEVIYNDGRTPHRAWE